MKVYVLQVTTDGYSACNAFEWENRGVYLKESDAEKVGKAYVKSNPDQEYSVEPTDVIEEVE